MKKSIESFELNFLDEYDIHPYIKIIEENFDFEKGITILFENDDEVESEFNIKPGKWKGVKYNNNNLIFETPQHISVSIPVLSIHTIECLPLSLIPTITITYID